MADIKALYNEFGIKGVLPHVNKRGDEAYTFLLDKMDAKDLFFVYEDGVEFPEFAQLENTFIVELRTEGDIPCPYSFEELGALGFTHAKINSYFVLKISDITGAPAASTDTLPLVKKFAEDHLEASDLLDKNFYLVGLTGDTQQAALFDIPDIPKKALMIFPNSIFAFEFIKDREGLCVYDIPGNSIVVLADKEDFAIALSFSSFGVTFYKGEPVDDFFVPDFLKDLAGI